MRITLRFWGKILGNLCWKKLEKKCGPPLLLSGSAALRPVAPRCRRRAPRLRPTACSYCLAAAPPLYYCPPAWESCGGRGERETDADLLVWERERWSEGEETQEWGERRIGERSEGMRLNAQAEDVIFPKKPYFPRKKIQYFLRKRVRFEINISLHFMDKL